MFNNNLAQAIETLQGVDISIDILKEIKKQNRTLPVIMLSSQKSYGTAAQTIMYGAVYYVIKGHDAFQEIYQVLKANV